MHVHETSLESFANLQAFLLKEAGQHKNIAFKFYDNMNYSFILSWS